MPETDHGARFGSKFPLTPKGLPVKYLSTRGEAQAHTFEGVLLAGLARDGGLYVPETWPSLDRAAIAGLEGLDYADAAYRVMAPFLEGDPCLADLRQALEEAYDGFHHPAVAPLRQIGSNLGFWSCFTVPRWHSRTSPCRWSPAS